MLELAVSLVTASLDDLWDWLEYIPHSGHSILGTLRSEGVHILCPINNVEEVILVMVIQGHKLPALALKYLPEAHVANVVNMALAYVALQVEFIFQSNRCLPRIEPELRVDEACVDQFEEDSKELGRVSLHVKVEELVQIVQLVEFCPKWVQG